MYGLLRAFVEDDPACPLTRHPDFGCFPHQAIFLHPHPAGGVGPARCRSSRGRPPNASTRVILLLAVPGVTRVPACTYRGFRTCLPLYACLEQDFSLDVIDCLIGLDPDVLALSGNRTTWFPVHHVIMKHKPVSVPLLSRLAEAKPETLLCRNFST
jgi:hypothetical protein